MEFDARDLAQRLGATLLSGGDAGGGAVDGRVINSRVIDGLAIDSRLVRPGQLFAALSAERDGHDFVTSAFASGAVDAKSTSGNVKVDLARVDGTSPLEFSSVSGNVVVRVPSGVGADVEMSTLSGSLHTDFPINVEERKYGPGKSAKGRVGDGARVVKMTSVSGNLNLSRS